MGQLDPKDFRRLNLQEINRERNLNLTIADLDREMYVFQRASIYRGFHGYQVIAKRLPCFWPLVPVLYLHGLTQLGEMIYRSVANSRLHLMPCDAECPANDQRLSDVIGNQRPSDMGMVRYPFLLGILLFIFVFNWFFKFEYYPLTPFPMYSRVPQGDVSRMTYYKAYSKFQDGTVRRTSFTESIGTVAISGYLIMEKMCFAPNGVEFCKKFLRAVGNQYNRSVPDSRRIYSYIIQKWDWDMGADFPDQNYGRKDQEFIFEILNTNE